MSLRWLTLTGMILAIFCWDQGYGAVKLQPGMRTGTPLTDAEFFAALNLDTKGLEKVKISAETGDFKAARGEFYHYLRDKFRRADLRFPPGPGEDTLQRADDLAFHGRIYFDNTGNTYGFDPSKPFDFVDFDPLNRDFHDPLDL